MHSPVEHPSRAIALQVGLAVTVSTVGILPMFLLGALVGPMRADLEFGLGAVGGGTAVLFAASSVAARRSGRLVQRLGSRAGIVLASLLASVSLGLGSVTQTYWHLAAALLLAGLANSVAQPAANLSLVGLTAETGAGFAFGIKQSAVPAASLFAGLAVPTVASSFGWRWVWVIGALAAVGVAVLAALLLPSRPRTVHVARVHSTHEMSVRELVMLTVGSCLATAACTSLGIFLVDSAVAGGFEVGSAGLLFAACSVVGLAARVGLGWLADARPGWNLFLGMAVLLVLGAVGNLMLSSGVIILYVLGAALAYGAGWAWPGLLHYGIVRDNPRAPAAATGVLQTGLSFGAATGPLAFGLLAAELSYQAAWSTLAVLSLAAAATVAMSQRPPTT